MQFSRNLLRAVCAAGALGVIGCHGSTETSQPTTMPMPETNMRSPGPTTMSVPAAMPQPVAAAPAAKDMTHVLAKDQPYFTSEPMATTPPAGTLKEGAKVLVIIPGAMYSQVVTDKGISAYTPTDGLKPIGK